MEKREKRFQIYAAIIAILAVIGVELNIRKEPLCFWLWVFSNAGTVYIHWRRKVWSHIALHSYFLIQAVRGIFVW